MKITWFPALADLPQFIIELSFLIGFLIVMIGSFLLFGLLCVLANYLFEIIYIRVRAPELFEMSKILFALGAGKSPKKQARYLIAKLHIRCDLYRDMPYCVQVSEILQNHTKLKGDTYKEQLQVMKDTFPNYRKLLHKRNWELTKEFSSKILFWLCIIVAFLAVCVVVAFLTM